MRRNTICKSSVIITLIMLALLPATVLASTEDEKNLPAATSEPLIAETDKESTLQEWFDANGYVINVTQDELGYETFEAGYYQITILAEIAGYASSNNLSWYSTSSGDLHLIFSEVNSTGDTMFFKAAEPFGLCLGTPNGLVYNEPDSHLFYSETNLNPDGFDHALVFANPNLPGGYIIVWEDLWEGGDKDFQDVILAMTPVIEAKVCIFPRTLNLKSRGRWITAFIWLPRGYDVGDIDVSTIMLNGTILAEPKPVAILLGDEVNSDNEDDDYEYFKILMVKFNRTAVIEYIKNTTAIDDDSLKWAKITLTVSGTLFNGQTFEGNAKIRIIHFPRCPKLKVSASIVRPRHIRRFFCTTLRKRHKISQSFK